MLKVHVLLDTLNTTGIINHNYMHIKVLVTDFFCFKLSSSIKIYFDNIFRS